LHFKLIVKILNMIEGKPRESLIVYDNPVEVSMIHFTDRVTAQK